MKYCIVSFQDFEIISKLIELGYYCYNVISSNRVSGPISDHSDILYQKTDKFELAISSCQKGNLPLLEKLGYKIRLIDNLKEGYRTESYLNYIINEKYIIYNPKTALVFNSEKECIKVNQGYTKCSTICVNNSAYITEDEGIYRVLKGHDFDCLLIKKGNVRLDGYEYGFIGGASVKLNEKEILFFGEIEDIEDKTKVIDFLNKYDMNAIFIENKKLHDIGSALILESSNI